MSTGQRARELPPRFTPPRYDNTVMAEAFVIEAIASWMKKSLGESGCQEAYSTILEQLQQSTYQFHQHGTEIQSEAERLLTHFVSSLR